MTTLDVNTFYRLRDDRTNRCVESPAYQLVTCTVTMQENLLSTQTGCVLFQVVCNLLARWCRTVTLVAPSQPAIEETLVAMRDADPFGTFTATTETSAAGIHLHLGRGCHAPTDQTVVIDAGGWLAWLGTTDGPALPTDEENILGAVAAACLGVAQAFKIASQGQRLRFGLFDLFSLSWTDTTRTRSCGEMTLGRLLLVGAGSVGSAAAYVLQLARAKVDLTIVDRDGVGIENLNRSPIFGIRDVGRPKVLALAGALAGSGVNVVPVELWWDEFVTSADTGVFDVWLPLANDRGVRWSMQHNIPPLMIHASTGVNGGVNFGRHIPGRGDCLVERFPELASAPLACATSPLPTPQGSVDAALPFASVFAGLLVVADLARLLMAGYPQVPNLAILDFGGELTHPVLVDRDARPGCLCHEQRDLAGRMRAGSRYAALLAK
jgi:hypothetical protein